MPDIVIRPVQPADIATLHCVVEAAFEPIFASFKGMMGPTIFAFFYPDWRQVQRTLVNTLIADADAHVWVGATDGAVVGFVSYRLKPEMEGEIELLFVDPAYEGGGLGTALNEFALQQMRAAGMRVATVATGGDPAHAPARRSYEKVGFRPIPQVWYIKALEHEA